MANNKTQNMKNSKFLSLFTTVLFIILLGGCSNVKEPDPEPTPIPVQAGDGTKASPYTVTQVIALNPTSTTIAVDSAVWVQGYIVGCYNTTPDPAVLETVAPFANDYNVMLALDSTETDMSKCVCVQLPAGAVRTALGLATIPTNIGKEVIVYGDIMKYNTFPGVKNTSAYWFVGTQIGIDPVDPIDPSDAIFSETFASSSQGSFTIQNVVIDAALTYVWAPTASYGMKASGFANSTKYGTESWLISPDIDLSSKTAATLTFQHAGKYFGTMSAEATLWISENYISGLPSTGTWTQLTIPTYMTGSDWTFVSSGNIDLASYVGKSNVRIAFKYISTTAAAGTWEVKNVLIQ